MEWQLHERGFLPMRDPVARLTDPDLKHLERLGADLPQLVHDRAFRDRCGDYLKPAIDWNSLLKSKPDAEIERLFLLFSYFASAYVHAPGLPPTDRLPAHLASAVGAVGATSGSAADPVVCVVLLAQLATDSVRRPDRAGQYSR